MGLNGRRFGSGQQNQQAQNQQGSQQNQNRQNNDNQAQREPNLGAGWANVIKGRKGDFTTINLKLDVEQVDKYIQEAELKGEDVSKTLTLELTQNTRKQNDKSPDWFVVKPWKFRKG